VGLGLDGSEGAAVPVPGIHTDFAYHPAGHAVALAYEVRDFDDGSGTRRILGTQLVQVEADGSHQVLWSVFDHHTPDLREEWLKGWYTADPEVEDWSHVNGIGYDPAADLWLLTSTYNDGLFAVDAATGEERWSVGVVDADILFPAGGDQPLSAPHGVEPEDGHLLVYNRATTSNPACAYITALEVESGAGTLTELDRYTPPECLMVPFLGNVLPTVVGDRALIHSSAGLLELVSSAGERRGEWFTPIGEAFGFGTALPPFPTR